MLYKKITNKQLMMLFMLLVSATAQAAFDCDSITWGSCDQEQGFTCNTGNNIPWVCCNVPRPDRSCDDGMCWTNSNVCPTDRCLTKQNFCQNGSTCQEGTCVCEGGFSGVFCEIPPFDCDSITWGSCDQEQGFTCNTGNNIPWVCCDIPRPDRNCNEGMCWTNSNVCPTDRCLTMQNFCENGSTCQDGTCVCEDGFSGTFCEIADAYIALGGFGQCGSLAGGAMLDRDIIVWYNDPNTDTREKCEAHCNNEPDCYAYSWKASYTDCSIHLDNCEPVDSYYNQLSGPSEWGNPDFLAASFVSQEDIVSSGSALGQGHSDALCYVRQDWEPVNEYFIKQFSNGEYCGHHGRELSEEECLKFTEWTVDQPQILPNATCRDCSPVDCEGIDCFFKHYWGGVVTELAQPRSCSRNSRDWINFNTVGSAMSGEAVCVAVCPTNCESDENCWGRLSTEDCGDIESWYRSSGRFLDNDGKTAFMLDTYNIALGGLDDARIDVLKASFLSYCNDISGRRRKL